MLVLVLVLVLVLALALALVLAPLLPAVHVRVLLPPGSTALRLNPGASTRAALEACEFAFDFAVGRVGFAVVDDCLLLGELLLGELLLLLGAFR
jgi:hypothetical protein